MFPVSSPSTKSSPARQGLAARGPVTGMARPALSAHPAPHTPTAEAGALLALRWKSQPCSPCSHRPPGRAVGGCNPSLPCFTWDRGCSRSQHRMVTSSCVRWVSPGPGHQYSVTEQPRWPVWPQVKDHHACWHQHRFHQLQYQQQVGSLPKSLDGLRDLGHVAGRII